MKEKYLEPEVTLLGFISNQKLANQGFDFDKDMVGGSSDNSGEGSAVDVWDEDLGFEW